MGNWNQCRSSFRTGEPQDHLAAKDIVSEKLSNLAYNVHQEYPLVDALLNNGYKHNYDVVGFGELVVIEVDDPNLHAKQKKIQNDKRAENYVRQFFPAGLKFLRLNKDEINDEDTGKEYLKEKLQDV